GHNADVHERLEANQKTDARSQEEPKGVAGVPCDVNAANHQHNERDENGEGSRKPQFFTDDRQNKIRVMLRNKAELLPAITQADARPAASAQREHRLIGLVANVTFGLVWIKPSQNAIKSHWIKGDGDGQSSYSSENRRQKKSQTSASDHQHRGANAH